MSLETPGSEASLYRRSKRLQLLAEKKRPFDLIDLLHQVPDILRHVRVYNLHVLLATSRALRSQVHHFATRISFREETDAQQLVNGSWTNLRSLRYNDSIHAVNMQHICSNSWQHLTTLNMRCVKLSHLCLQHLAQGNWPALQNLNLMHANLRGDRMATLQQGKWPTLKILDLAYCNMDSISMTHLTAAPWAQLEDLCLAFNFFTAADVEQLSKSDRPQLRTLFLSGALYHTVYEAPSEDDPDLMTLHGDRSSPSGDLESNFIYHLSKARWPLLEHLSLHGNNLSSANFAMLPDCHWPLLKLLVVGGQALTPESCASISKAHWPLLDYLSLSDTHLSSDAMSYIIKADWPMLREINMSQNQIHAATYEQLARGQWPQLDKLCLRGSTMDGKGLEALVKGQWPRLKLIDLAVSGLVCHDVVWLSATRWPILECLELNIEDDLQTAALYLSPQNTAGLCGEDNEISNPSVVLDGQWPNLRMLNFCEPDAEAVWFEVWDEQFVEEPCVCLQRD